MDEVIQVNNSNDEEPQYKIFLWCGAGYWLQQFNVYASNVEQALERVVVWCEQNNYNNYLIDVEEVTKLLNEKYFTEEEIDESFLYIDATMEDATKPYYIYLENLRIEEIKKEEQK